MIKGYFFWGVKEVKEVIASLEVKDNSQVIVIVMVIVMVKG